LLAAAVSPSYDTTVARRRTRNGIWSYHSPFDWLQLGLGTLAVGTYDGTHSVSAGMVGFRDSNPQVPGDVVADSGAAGSIVDNQTRHATSQTEAEDLPASHDLSAAGEASVGDDFTARKDLTARESRTPREDLASPTAAQAAEEIAPFRQIAYRFAMLRSWNFGGHHGWANRLFAAEWLAAVVLEACRSPS